MSRFGFVVHPLVAPQRMLMGVRTLTPALLWGEGTTTPRVAKFPRVVSATGAFAEGDVRAVGMLPASMLVNQEPAVERIAAAAGRLAADGASIVGLGALCAVVGSRGEEVARRVQVPVTTGVSYTAFAAGRTLDRVADALGETLAGSSVAIAGLPGALAVAVAELCAERGVRLVLLDGPVKAREKLGARLTAQHGVAVELPPDPAPAARAADFLVGASSTGNALDPGWLGPGSVVVDVAEPRDLPRSAALAPDCVVVDGENVSLPPDGQPGFGLLTGIYNWVVGQRLGTVYACFAEPIVLALEGKAESFSLGKEISAAKAGEIGRLGERHGFRVDRLLHGGFPVHAGKLEHVSRLRSARRSGAVPPSAARQQELT